MALPSSGAISMSQVNTELGKGASAAISLNDSAVRSLAGKSSGIISMSDLLGKSAASWHYHTYIVTVDGKAANPVDGSKEQYGYDGSMLGYGRIRTTSGGPLPNAVYSSTSNTNRLYVSLSQWVGAATKSVEWPGFYARRETTGNGINFIDINEVFSMLKANNGSDRNLTLGWFS